jgi:hypothetical protein
MAGITNNQKVIGLIVIQALILAVIVGLKSRSPKVSNEYVATRPPVNQAPVSPMPEPSPSNNARSNSPISQLDGQWYSSQWKYGYEMNNGTGIATSTNSANFSVGDKIINLVATGPNTFEGMQVYKDGNLYSVTVTLLSDGRMYFQGEKNVNWYMERVSGARPAPVRVQEPVQAANAWIYLEGTGSSTTYYSPRSIQVSGRNLSVLTVVSYPYPSKVFFSNVKVGSFTQNMVFRCGRATYNVTGVSAYADAMGQGALMPTNPIDTTRDWPVTGGFASIYNQYCP